MGPFDRFNDRAKRVLALAQDEAVRFNHNYIGTEHLLLGLVREGEGIAAGVLESLGVNLDKVRHEVIRVLSQSSSAGPAPNAARASSLPHQRHPPPTRTSAAGSGGWPSASHLTCGILRG